MPCMGPEPVDLNKLNAAYNDVMALLKTKYGIQYHEPNTTGFGVNSVQLRCERNNDLKHALHGLFELHNWENF